MRRSFRFATAVSVTLALAVGGCSDSSTSAGDPIQPEVAMEIAMEVMFVAFDIFEGGFGGAPVGAGPLALGSPPPALGSSESFSVTVPCEGGGTVAATGTMTSNIDSETGDGTIASSYSQTPSNCGVSTSQGLYRVSGSPSLNSQFEAVFEDWWIVAATMNMGGGFSWTGPAGSGTCSIDVSVTYQEQPFSMTISGTVCGHNVSV